jgi:hypothetical protein
VPVSALPWPRTADQTCIDFVMVAEAAKEYAAFAQFDQRDLPITLNGALELDSRVPTYSETRIQHRAGLRFNELVYGP